MPTISEVRAKYPMYSDVDDATLLKGLHAKHYADMPYEQFAAKITPEAPAPVAEAPTPEQPRSMGQTAIDSFKGLNPLRQVVGLGETALQMGTGMASQALGGIHGLATLATGGSMDDATQRIKQWEQAGTYQPRTQQGQTASQLAALPLEKASEGAGWVGEKVGGEAGRAIGEVTPALALTLAGGAGALKAAPKTPIVRPALEGAKALAERGKAAVTGEVRAPTAAQVAESRLNAPQIDAANLAKKYGIAIDPTAVGPKGRALSAFAGETNVAEALAAANRGKFELPLKRELGIADDATISMEAIEGVRSRAAGASEEIARMGRLAPDEATVSGINALRVEQPTIGGGTAARLQNRLVDEALAGVSQGMDAPMVLENIRSLRKRARDIYKKSDAGPEQLATAETSMGIANALEGMVESNLQRVGNTELLGRYRQGRQDLAKSYVLEDIVDLNTGRIDPAKLSKLTSKDNALTGAFKDIGQIVGVFPETIGKGAKSAGGDVGYGIRRAARTGIPGFVGEATALLSNLPRSMAARRVASPKYQAKNATPTDFRPLRERMGYGDPIPEAQPWTLAPEGEALPTTRQNIEPTVRPTLELAPMDAEIAALRNKGAKVPMDEGMVEFTPGARMDYPLRQELLDSPKSATLDYLRDKIAELEKTKDKSLGFWKQRYAKELEEMQPILEAEKQRYGITDAASEHGLRRKLYEGGGSTVYPIIKTLRRQ